MPCQCTTAPIDVGENPTDYSGCGCETESNAGCGCASAPTPSDREGTLERIVMELDKRVRKLEASR